VSATPQRSASASGEQGINAAKGGRFFDNSSQSWMVKVFPGEFHVTARPDETLVTVLGSCVAACIRDPVTKLGGMNHFMLPQGHSSGWGNDPQSTRYGNFAMEKLINELIKGGCSRDRMEIKVFGGGNVIDSISNRPVGTQNAEFVLHFLEAEGLRCAVQDLGGQYPRRIHYSPATGRVVRRLLGTGDSHVITREETEYAARLLAKKPAGDVELFV
jgi:chemotaxis protein CheD